MSFEIVLITTTISGRFVGYSIVPSVAETGITQRYVSIYHNQGVVDSLSLSPMKYHFKIKIHKTVVCQVVSLSPNQELLLWWCIDLWCLNNPCHPPKPQSHQYTKLIEPNCMIVSRISLSQTSSACSNDRMYEVSGAFLGRRMWGGVGLDLSASSCCEIEFCFAN